MKAGKEMGVVSEIAHKISESERSRIEEVGNTHLKMTFSDNRVHVLSNIHM